MRGMIPILAVGVFLVASPGCTTEFCASGADCLSGQCNLATNKCLPMSDGGPGDGGDPSDGGNGCQSSLDCLEPLRPYCDPLDGQCRSCIVHDDCAHQSGACDLATGRCMAEADLLYVDINDPVCNDAGSGTRDVPFCSVQAGADEATAGAIRTVVVFQGAYDRLDLIDFDELTLIAAGPSVTLSTASSNPTVQIAGRGRLTMENFVLANNTDNPAVHCTGMGGTETTVVLYRNRILENVGGGLLLNDCSFDLVNNVVALNGDPNGGGGIVIAALGPGATTRFHSNTVVENTNAGGVPGGILCTSPVAIVSSIFENNSFENLGVNCTYTYTLIDDSSGTDGLIGNPSMSSDCFLDLSNYHLQASSTVCIDAGDTDTTITVDIDGQPRPNGAVSDIGADEFYP